MLSAYFNLPVWQDYGGFYWRRYISFWPPQSGLRVIGRSESHPELANLRTALWFVIGVLVGIIIAFAFVWFLARSLPDGPLIGQVWG